MGWQKWSVALLFGSVLVGAQANPLNFDDVHGYTYSATGCTYTEIPKATCTNIPYDYHGLNMPAFWVINGCAYAPDSQYCKGTVDKLHPNVAVVPPSTAWSVRDYYDAMDFDGVVVTLLGGTGTITLGTSFFGNDFQGETINIDHPAQVIERHYDGLATISISSSDTMILDNIQVRTSLCKGRYFNFGFTSDTYLGTQRYKSSMGPLACQGYISANQIDPANGNATVQSNGQLINAWDGSCTLTGQGHIPSNPYWTRVTYGVIADVCDFVPPAARPQHGMAVSDRLFVTVDPQSGTVNNLFNDTYTASDYTSDHSAQYGSFQWLRYIAGDRSNEGLPTTDGSFRQRISVLGDIINSSPAPVGPPQALWDQLLVDRLTKASLVTEAAAYARFKQENSQRTNVVYVGANDGFLHAFRAGVLDAQNHTIGTVAAPNDGKELLAYSPSNALATLYSSNDELSYADQHYTHQYYVDGSPGTGDAYLQGQWQTLLIGGLGAGGNAAGPVHNDRHSAAGLLYVMNITDPGNFSAAAVKNGQLKIQELNSGAAGVAGVIDNATITCNHTKTPCSQHMGAIYGTPAIVRMHNGHWNAIFGNGLYAQSGHGGVFILNQLDNVHSGDNYYLDAPATVPKGVKNGIVEVNGVDLDGDGIIDYIYAGDVLGNVWRFDVTSANPADWASTAPVKVFPMPGFMPPNLQPITTKVLVTTVATGAGTNNILMEFGTGRAYPLISSGIYSTYPFIAERYSAAGIQTIYGVWDWQLAKWNALPSATQDSHYKYHAVDALPMGSTLRDRDTVLTAVRDGYGLSRTSYELHPVCWIEGSNIADCANYNEYGWKLDLPGIGGTRVTCSYSDMGTDCGAHEQVVYNPVLWKGYFILNTINAYPATAPLLPYTIFGYTVYLDNNGLPSGFANSHEAPLIDYKSNGLVTDASGTPELFTDNNSYVWLFVNVDRGLSMLSIEPGIASTDLLGFHPAPVKKTLKTVTWTQLR